MNIRQATLTDLDQLSILFAKYRVFYEQPFEPDKAKQFLEERLGGEECIIFIAIENEQQAGFTQLYPSFSSVGMTKIWILNDLFVSTGYRQKGIAQALITHVIEYSKTTGRKKLCCQRHTVMTVPKNCMRSLALTVPASTITK